MLLHKKEKRYKKLLALDNRRKELWQQQRQRKPIKLDKPIFNGYVGELVLREETLRRPDGPRIKELVEWLGQDKAFCRDKTFIRHNGRNAVKIEPALRGIADPRFAYFPTESRRHEVVEKIHKFQKYLERHCGNCWACKDHLFRSPHYVFKYLWMLEIKITPHYLTHYYPIDGDIESELAKIHDILYVNSGLLYGRDNDDREQERKYRLQNKKVMFSEQDVDNRDFRW